MTASNETSACTKCEMRVWLNNLPEVSRQSEIRTQVVMQAINKTAESDPVVHYFLGVPPQIILKEVVFLLKKHENVAVQDVFICWVLQSGKVFAIDADNRANLFRRKGDDPMDGRPVIRWHLARAPLVIEIAHDLARSIRDYLPQICETVGSVCRVSMGHRQFTAGETAFAESLRVLLKNRLHQLQEDGILLRADLEPLVSLQQPSVSLQQQVPEVSDPEPIEVTVTIQDSVTPQFPNRAHLLIKGTGKTAITDVRELVHINDAHGFLDASTPQSIQFQNEMLSVEFAVGPRMIQQLARLRIWAEHHTASQFQVQADAEDLPITVVRN